MPITSVDNAITLTPPVNGQLAQQTDVHDERDFAIHSKGNKVKQIQFSITQADTTAATYTINASVTESTTYYLSNFVTLSTGFVGIGTTPSTKLHIQEYKNLTAATADAYSAGITLDPIYTAGSARTLDRHNYINAKTPDISDNDVTLTDACLVRFDANAGTHKAVDGATTKTTPGGVDAWVKININGTLAYIPAYLSKTA
jgi:hypothetical protein